MLFPPPTPHSQFHALFLTLSLREKKNTSIQTKTERNKNTHKPLQKHKNGKQNRKINKQRICPNKEM